MTRKKIIITAITIFLISLCILNKILSNAMGEFNSKTSPSRSINESKEYGVFVKKVTISPASIKEGNTVIHFNEAWIEETSRHEYHLLFIKKVIKEGKYRICFTLKNPVIGNFGYPNFFADTNNNAFGYHGLRENLVISRDLPAEKIKSNKIILTYGSTWFDPRRNKILLKY